MCQNCKSERAKERERAELTWAGIPNALVSIGVPGEKKIESELIAQMQEREGEKGLTQDKPFAW